VVQYANFAQFFAQLFQKKLIYAFLNWTNVRHLFTPCRVITAVINPSVAMVFLKTYVAIGGGGK